jgi:hypothetical protein
MSKYDSVITEEIEREVRRNYEVDATSDPITALKSARDWLDELCSLIQCGDFQAAEDWVSANAVSTDSTLCEVIVRAGGYDDEEDEE